MRPHPKDTEKSSGKWNIYISFEARVPTPLKKTLKFWIKTSLVFLSEKDIPDSVNEISIVITDDKNIRKLNKEFRHIDKATDVLSFCQMEDSFSHLNPSLGDIVISIQTARRQAREFGVSLDKELLRLYVHGLVHLLGYDHVQVSQKKRNEMKRKEREILRQLDHY